MSSSRRRPRVFHPVTEGLVSRVKQDPKDEVDINNIMRNMKRGVMPPAWMTSNTPHYGDFTSGPQSLMEAYDVVARAEAAFESLPLEFRRAIDHDPRNLGSAPRELYEKFGLLKQEALDAAKAAKEPPAAQRVQGDRDLPGKARQGAKKGTQDVPVGGAGSDSAADD